jgi:hypothetical protein
MMHNKIIKNKGWLLFFYSAPSRPVGFRVKIWRKLIKAGALSIKGAVYLLPDNEDNFEYFQWLVSEIESRRGEAALVRVEKLETMNNKEIVDLFNQARTKDYQIIEKSLEEIERRLDSIKKGGSAPPDRKVSEQSRSLMKEFEEIRRLDFFESKMGEDLNKRVKAIKLGIERMGGPHNKKQDLMIVTRTIENYMGKIWVTRKKPFVDRMASAWLVKKFIDKNAAFKFIHERAVQNLQEDYVAFDIRGGEFTHMGEMCTFEVIAKSFAMDDRNVRKIAEIVHELDIKDDRFHNPEARGIEIILSGIRKSGKSDEEILEKGIAIFEMLYAA